MKTDGNESIYPVVYTPGFGSGIPVDTPHGKVMTGQEGGLTKREWFAGMALQGILSGDLDVCNENVQRNVRTAVCYAYQMINELSGGKK